VLVVHAGQDDPATHGSSHGVLEVVDAGRAVAEGVAEVDDVKLWATGLAINERGERG